MLYEEYFKKQKEVAKKEDKATSLYMITCPFVKFEIKQNEQVFNRLLNDNVRIIF